MIILLTLITCWFTSGKTILNVNATCVMSLNTRLSMFSWIFLDDIWSDFSTQTDPSPFNNRELYICGRGRLRVRYFLNTKKCTFVSQRHFGGENVIAVIIHYEFTRECRSGGNKLSNVKSFTILLSGEGLTSFSINDRTNFFKLSWGSFFENAQKL